MFFGASGLVALNGGAPPSSVLLVLFIFVTVQAVLQTITDSQIGTSSRGKCGTMKSRTPMNRHECSRRL
jgi:hypothetical protein